MAKSVEEAELELAALEYVNRFLTTCSFLEAESAYKQTLGKLDVEVPEEVRRDAIDRRSRMLEILRPEILQVKRKEFKELQTLEAHLHCLMLRTEVAEEGIPDDVTVEDLRVVSADDITSVINGVKKLQEMRRDILSS